MLLPGTHKVMLSFRLLPVLCITLASGTLHLNTYLRKILWNGHP